MALDGPLAHLHTFHVHNSHAYLTNARFTHTRFFVRDNVTSQEIICFIAPLGRKNRERERQRAMIQERLEERKRRWEREMEQQKAEQSQMVAEQEKAIKQVLNTQAGLAEEYVY